MINDQKIRFEHLGQTGLRIDLSKITVLIDPYLSNSVQELESDDLERLIPIPYKPSELNRIDWVIITHDHMDHCDPHTIPLLAQASPKARFMGPLSVRKQLIAWGIAENRIIKASGNFYNLSEELKVRSIPAAHPRIRTDKDNEPETVGYLLAYRDKQVYVAGDTKVCDEVIDELKRVGIIDLAFLPVNEDNYYRRRRGIIGNMSIRDAFGLASELKIKSVVPVHWDMFAINSTTPEEIKAVYNSHNWPFALINPLEINQ